MIGFDSYGFSNYYGLNSYGYNDFGIGYASSLGIDNNHIGTHNDYSTQSKTDNSQYDLLRQNINNYNLPPNTCSDKDCWATEQRGNKTINSHYCVGKNEDC